MDSLILPIVALIVLIAVVAALMTRFVPKAELPYQRKQLLFSPAERSFLGVLEQAIGSDYRIFGKVRVVDIIEPRSGLDRKSRQQALNRVVSKHFDFVICTLHDLAVICVIELDDRSHHASKRQDRDVFLDGLCRSVELPLLRFPARHAYSMSELREQVQEALGLIAATNATEDIPAGSETTLSAADSGAPSCPKCSASMIRREAKSGGNVGGSFWGCSRFPRCRATIPME